MGQSVDSASEVISRLRFSSDEGAKYSGDLMAVMDILKNTTELYKATRLRLNNADVEVRQNSETSLFLSGSFILYVHNQK